LSILFAPHTDELKKKISGRIKVLRCFAGRSWDRNPLTFRSLYGTQSCTLYCASSWLASTAANYLRKLEFQHLAGARIITGCTRSTQQFLFSRKQVYSPGSPWQPCRSQAETARSAPHAWSSYSRRCLTLSRTAVRTALGWRCGTEIMARLICHYLGAPY